ncbi:DegT/DnrJ/EryC1/StrS family aminotransferase [Leekyejoonella antrihumi]|uniref:Aminotransferase class V-fold PLP-dependent enzyme n=1 Tax=Leekyejoonella antrihumi TaxID=1660198 RepID=A0A563DZK6_9MICO|nr:aminotransferase class V-fold PLP-dependent enzyme [Leekyejoonella antrihumi]TWP35074.1 aminotransferase class V-fold PLP-dependent enzyme [Leekyejoonella antrihumi]
MSLDPDDARWSTVAGSVLPYGRQTIDEGDVDAVSRVLRGDWLTTGPAVDQFEAGIAGCAGVSHPAVAVSSGTAALHTAYAALKIGHGDEVVTTPLTFLATATCAIWQGATVRFADVSEDTGNLDPDAVAATVTGRTKVVAGVDYGGHPIDAPALCKVAHDAGAMLLEDAAHSIGGSLNGTPVGALADVTTFSFFPTKNLTTAEGGAVASNDAELLTRARAFKGIGMVRDSRLMRSKDVGAWYYEMPELGLNYRLPDVLAALGANQLKRLQSFKARRQAIADRYHAGFGGLDVLRLPTHRQGADPMWHLFPLRIQDGRRRQLFEYLRENGVGAQVNYVPVYWQPYFADLGYRRGMCPVAESYYEQEISLPMFPSLADSDIDRVIDLIRIFVEG